jgi:hypothetical protein
MEKTMNGNSTANKSPDIIRSSFSFGGGGEFDFLQDRSGAFGNLLYAPYLQIFHY